MSEPFIGQIAQFAGNFAPRGWALCDGQILAISDNQALFSLLGTQYGGDGRVTFGLPDLRGRVPIHAGSGPGLSSYRLGEKDGDETINLTVRNLPEQGFNFLTTDADPIVEALEALEAFPNNAVLSEDADAGPYPVPPARRGLHSSGDGADDTLAAAAAAAGMTVEEASELLNEASRGRRRTQGSTVLCECPADESNPLEAFAHPLRGETLLSVKNVPAADAKFDIKAVPPRDSTGGGQAVPNRQPYGVINYIIALQGIFPSRS